jgi:hypothetical protein
MPLRAEPAPVPNIAVQHVTGKPRAVPVERTRSPPARPLADLAAHARAAGTLTSLIDLAVLALRIHNRQIRS